MSLGRAPVSRRLFPLVTPAICFPGTVTFPLGTLHVPSAEPGVQRAIPPSSELSRCGPRWTTFPGDSLSPGGPQCPSRQCGSVLPKDLRVWPRILPGGDLRGRPPSHLPGVPGTPSVGAQRERGFSRRPPHPLAHPLGGNGGDSPEPPRKWADASPPRSGAAVADPAPVPARRRDPRAPASELRHWERARVVGGRAGVGGGMWGRLGDGGRSRQPPEPGEPARPPVSVPATVPVEARNDPPPSRTRTRSQSPVRRSHPGRTEPVAGRQPSSAQPVSSPGAHLLRSWWLFPWLRMQAGTLCPSRRQSWVLSAPSRVLSLMKN